jgi:hypothetical protein
MLSSFSSRVENLEQKKNLFMVQFSQNCRCKTLAPHIDPSTRFGLVEVN